MLLNDNEYSLQTIQEKTNITIENLEKLSQKDWSHFKKPQANGLISIIEREFSVDLSNLKAEANAYFNEHLEKEPECPIDLVDAATIGGSGSRILSNFITIVSLCAVGYAGWYYFVENQKEHSIDSNSTTYEKDSGMFADTINSAKRLLGVVSDSNKTDSSSSTEEKAKKQEKQESKQESIVQEQAVVADTQTPKKESVAKESPKSELNNSAKTEVKKFDITTVAQESQATPAKENKSEVLSNQESTAVNDESKADSNSDAGADGSSVKGEVDNLLKELDANNSETKEESSEDNGTVVIASETNNTESSDTENNNSAVAITKATFNLKAKRLWLGIYNLTTHKRISKSIKRPFTLNVGEDKFAIVTGHSGFEIAIDNGVKTFAKKGKVYFTIDKDGIKQLDRREYRKLTKRRAW